jgi:glycosyltransferase involved in cell wall biosynthesis
VSGATLATRRSLRKVQQRASHASLYRDVSQSPAPAVRSRRGRLDAIIVPASRPASFLQPAIDLSAWLGVLLIILSSQQTKLDFVAERVGKTPGARALIAPMPEKWRHPKFPRQTSADIFRRASANRRSDLSAKRNLGLLLARLHGLNKIVFIDDDVRLSRSDNIARLAKQLDKHQVAGMVVREYPDNSVVCHARRLAGAAQDVFVTGAVLGVHCNNLPLSFFPDIYNEDWFFFAEEAAARELPRVGQARQADYDPFATPDRARREEFGDLLAEGFYSLIEEVDPSLSFDQKLCCATSSYWERFIDARRQVMTETRARLGVFACGSADKDRVTAALESLTAAEIQLDAISPELCVNFIDAWRDDVDKWRQFSNGVNNVRSTRAAMDFLNLENWIQIRS